MCTNLLVITIRCKEKHPSEIICTCTDVRAINMQAHKVAEACNTYK